MEIKCAYDKLVPLSELKPHPKNPNRHSQDQIERLAKIIAYQGIRRPIRISTASGFITAGHGLLLALRHLGETEVPVNFQSYDSEDQEFADIVADNSIASWADLDLSAINLEVPNLGPEFDINFLGLKDFEIDAFEREAYGALEIKKDSAEAFSSICPRCGFHFGKNLEATKIHNEI